MRSNPYRTPLFFKLWFGFIAALIVTIIGLQIYVASSVIGMADKPEQIGGYFGQILKGFEEGRK